MKCVKCNGPHKLEYYHHQINTHLLKEISDKKVTSLVSFSKAKLIDVINRYNNFLTLELDKLFWRYLKKIVKNEECINELINITNVCINLCHWLSHFKTSTTIILFKPNKTSYDSTKSFCLIVLLNTTRKLFEKMIGEWLQFLLIFNNFIYSC